MVSEQLAHRGIADRQVLAAFNRVLRHLFVPTEHLDTAYEDHPLPIGEGQTISQPYIVAYMIEQLQLTCSERPTGSPGGRPERVPVGSESKGAERVLEIGTGSGYETALLAELAGSVYTVERIKDLSEAARKRLASLGYKNIFFKVGDGSLGWKKEMPFDRIIVSAGAPKVPPSLINQLANNGIMIIPVGDEYFQNLTKVEKQNNKITQTVLDTCVFVKLIGEEGW